MKPGPTRSIRSLASRVAMISRPSSCEEICSAYALSQRTPGSSRPGCSPLRGRPGCHPPAAARARGSWRAPGSPRSPVGSGPDRPPAVARSPRPRAGARERGRDRARSRLRITWSCRSSTVTPYPSATLIASVCRSLSARTSRTTVGGTGLEDPVALRAVDESGLLHRAQQDLEVDLAVGGVHSRGVVDEVGVHAPAGQGELDAGRLRQAQVAALADDPAAQLVGRDPDPVVAPVRHVGIGLVRGPHVGADARRSTAGRPARAGRPGPARRWTASSASMPSAARACGDNGTDLPGPGEDAAAREISAGS